ncbi:ABC transporter transmembrane region 2 family [Synechococcus sp. PCC 7335]|uniref:ABC transporter ATP-binding protein/permease n=1 Tax=Synechococcus sp. (strain ATCC 29403 / PCC 7335) TaxID=91464 RepID=UPI00017EBC86|nr:ABC transporter ATP-binding protein/permease [Synechococcus sp. PCC 7335]EDX86096.1 ABC transporter transmembrane region 2 family [Synechococcus sp. PCC 7335]
MSTPSVSSAKRESRFRFDRQLWQRFITIAQPYFFPISHRLTRVYLGLLLLLLVAVVAVAFWLTVGLTFAGRAIFPAFFSNVAGQLVERVNGLLASWAPYGAIAALAIVGLVVYRLRRLLRERAIQWAMLGLLLLLSFTVNGINVSISYVFRFVDTALNQRETDTFWQFLFVYAGIIIGAIPLLVLYRYVRLKLALRWRKWLTEHFLERYFANRSYYELDSNSANTEIDNPDQRITQDIKSFTEVTLSFLLDILDSVLTLISFTAILYTISKTLTVGLLIYATVGTLVAAIAGRKLIKINYDQLRLEADFRYGMVHVRDNAESIAFYRGEGPERQQVSQRLLTAIRNFDLLIIWRSLIDLFQYGYNYFTRIVPYVIVAPLYFAGDTDFGTFTQASIAFSQVLSALSLITNRIEQIAEFAASINRLGDFYERMDDPALPQKRKHQHEIKTEVSPQFSLNELTILTPNSEQTLVKDLSLQIEPRDRLLIVGASGCGKSSLLRAIAGLWTNGKGQITRPEAKEMLFLPQRPYMLLGTLREQLIYPYNYKHSDKTLANTLNQVNLSDLPKRFGGWDTIYDWSSVLSLGQQQRLAFARILLSQPAYAMMDEATSALDIDNERYLYDLLAEMQSVYVSVGHRPSLLDYHHKVLELDSNSAWKIYSAAGYRQKATSVSNSA